MPGRIEGRATPAVQPTRQDPPAAPAAAPAAPAVSRASARNLANLSGASNGSFGALPPVASQSPAERMAAAAATAAARATAAGAVHAATREYGDARAEVNRLNAHLERALRDEPALQDPASAERYRAAFMAEHEGAFARERATAAALADSIRAAETLLRATPRGNGMFEDAPAMQDRMTVARGLDTLAQSSEFAQAATLAGQLRGGVNSPLPPDVADAIADRAAVTGMRQDLANGRSVADSITRASTMLGVAGFVSRTPALSSLGNALATRDNVNEFIRTGDPARIGAAGFAALGAGGAAYAAVVGGGPVTIGVAALAFGGKAICEAVAGRNDYRRDTDAAYLRAFGTTRAAVDELAEGTLNQALHELYDGTGVGAPPKDHFGRIDPAEGRVWVVGRQAELLRERMAALVP